LTGDDYSAGLNARESRATRSGRPIQNSKN
jgi:hypothetical protein